MSTIRGTLKMSDDDQKTSWVQRLYERPFVLLFLGLGVMFLFYTIWGMIEILSLPVATLP